MQLCYFSQYIILFILDIVAYRTNFLANLPYSFGIAWFKLALWLGIPFWLLIFGFGGAAARNVTPFFGGFHWQAAAYALWESFFCIGVCLGLLVLFREKYNTQGKLVSFISDNAFGVYVFHAPLLVGITLCFRWLTVYPLLKIILMAVIVLPVSFGTVYLIRKIPYLEKVFS